MRKPKIENKYNLSFSDVKKLKVGDRSKVCEPLFWRNDVVNAWCISETTVKNSNDSRYGTYLTGNGYRKVFDYQWIVW